MKSFNREKKKTEHKSMASRKYVECNKVNAMSNSYFCSNCAEDFYRK